MVMVCITGESAERVAERVFALLKKISGQGINARGVWGLEPHSS
jgi:hypothetical protein